MLVPWLALIVFSFRQDRLLLFGFNGLTVAAGAVAVLLLQLSRSGPRAWLPFSGALLSATVTAHSGIQGLFIWPAGLVQLVPRDGGPELRSGSPHGRR